MAGPDRIEESRRYVFGEDERSYGIWEKGGGEEPLERFPVTDEGFDQGFTRFLELRAMERRMRGQLPNILTVVVAVGAVSWLAAGPLGAVLASGLLVVDADARWALLLATVVDALGYRLAVAGLLLLALLLLIRWERRTRRADDPAERGLLAVTPDPAEARGVWEAVLRWAFLLGSAVWILTAVATEVLFPLQREYFQTGEPLGFLAARAVEALSFRVWVVALVLLLLRWGRAWLRRREGSPASPERPPT